MLRPSTRRRVALRIQTLLDASDLRATTTRHILTDLTHTAAMPDTPEARRHARGVLRECMWTRFGLTRRSRAPGLPPPPRVDAALRVADGGRVVVRLCVSSLYALG